MSSMDIKRFLGIETRGREPSDLKHPVPSDHFGQLSEFLAWMFGDESRRKVVEDSRDITNFGLVLADEAALDVIEPWGLSESRELF